MDNTDALRVPEAPRPGDEVGVYRLLDELGAGGMGRVFLAEHQKLGRRVALKVLQPELWHNRRSVQRFFQEARLVNRIDHENIVEIYDYVQEADGLSYLIMELLVGSDLSQSREKQGPFALGRTIPILRQMAAALAAAHAEGVVHRDLKPGNIFLVQKGSRRDFVKLLDFGIAKLQDDISLEGPHTRTGAIVGTPLYMSPEQASGDKIDPRSDLYSLGVVAFWMLADSFPFKAKSFAELLQKQQSQRPSELPPSTASGDPIPAALARIVHRCLERLPDARFQSAGELEAALAPLVTEGSGTDVRSDAPSGTRRPPVQLPPAPLLNGPTLVLPGAAAGSAAGHQKAAARRAFRGRRVALSAAAILAGMGAVTGAYLLWEHASGLGSNDLPPAPVALKPQDATVPNAPLPAGLEVAPAKHTEPLEPADPEKVPVPPAHAEPPARHLAAAPMPLQPSHHVREHERARPAQSEHKATEKAPASRAPSGDDDVLDPFGK